MFVRSSESYSNAPRRRGLTFIAIVVALVYLFLTGLSTIWTDYLWFESVGFESAWQTNLVTSVVLGAIGIVVVFAVIWGNLLLTDRISPRMELLDLGEDEELVERFREWVEPRLRMVRLGVAAAFGLLLGLGVAAWRDEVLLFPESGFVRTGRPSLRDRPGLLHLPPAAVGAAQLVGLQPVDPDHHPGWHGPLPERRDPGPPGK
jgi:hypothetical protein